MPEEVQQVEKTKAYSFEPKSIVRVFIFIIGGRILEGWGLPLSVALLLSGSISTIVDYWIPPREKESFFRYFVFMESILIGSILALFIIPPYLKTFVPNWLAYALPFFFLSTLIYFLIAPKKRQYSFAKWVCGSAIFAAIIAVLTALFSSSK
jgi:hypothetical protein